MTRRLLTSSGADDKTARKGAERRAKIEAFAERTGVDCVSLDSNLPLEWAAKALPKGLAVQGNLDNLLLVAGGEAMDRTAETIVKAFADRPHIFNLGHGILPETPVAHVERLLAVVRDS